MPFELEDKTKPGHRKILVFFFVDPTIRIPSATDVAPQQYDFLLDAMLNPVSGSLLGNLPVEIVQKIADLVEGTMSRKAAEEYRLELMRERTVNVDSGDRHRYFGQVSHISYRIRPNSDFTERSCSICGELQVEILGAAF